MGRAYLAEATSLYNNIVGFYILNQNYNMSLSGLIKYFFCNICMANFLASTSNLIICHLQLQSGPLSCCAPYRFFYPAWSH